MISIILAEDHHIVRGGLKSLLEKEAGFHIVGEAKNGGEVIELLNEGVHADIILADMNMPVMGGLELIEQLRKLFPGPRTIVLSALDHENYVIKAFQSGAYGYLLKSVSPDELIFAIKHTHANMQYICSELSVRFLKRLLSLPEPVNYTRVQNLDFTDRDIEVLGLISEGFTNQEVADKLFSSKRTIENHRQQMLDKTGAKNIIALVKFAIINGII